MKAFRCLHALALALTLAAPVARAEQGTIVGPTIGPKTMTEVMTTLNAALLAIQSCNSGTSAPANGPGDLSTNNQCWADTTSNPIVYKRYDGASWVAFGKMNTSTHAWTPIYQGTDAGTAMMASTGTSGHTLGFLDGANTWSGVQSFNSAMLSLKGSTSGAGVLNAPAVAASYTWTLPALTDTLIGKATVDTLTNKTFDTAATGNSLSINGLAATANTGTGSVVRATSPALTTPTLGVAAATSINKVVITAPASSATLTIPDGVTFTGPAASGVAMTLGNAETVAGAKSFNDATVILKGATSGSTTVKAAAVAGTTTLTLPGATDTLVGRATADTFTNKTFDTAATGNSLLINGVAASANTGTGAMVRTNSPALVTPTGIVKGDVGLGNVDNTSDATKNAATRTSTNETYDTASNTFKLNGAAFGTATQATAALNAMVGDGGSGGTKGLVPAPGAGDAAAGKYLKADGTFAIPPGTGGGGALSDVDRQNILLDRIYQSKVFGGYRRFVNAFADGYKASDGINAGSSSNYTVDTGTGRVLPSTTAGVLISQATGTNFGDLTVNGGLTAIFDGNTNQATAASAVKTSTLSGYAGKNYSSSPKTVGSAKVYGANDTGYTSGANVTFNLRGKSTSPSSASDGTLLGSVGPIADVGSTNAQTLTSNDQTTTWNYIWVEMVPDATTNLVLAEVEFYAPATINSMTLVTTAQTADATVSSGRILAEFDNSATPTLNTDLTAEVTCNGTNWASASLSIVGTGQSGRKIAETVDQACGTSGTSFAARMKTANGKSVPIAGLSLAVH